MTPKILKLIILTESTVIALGVLAVMLIRDYRSGVLNLSDPVKAVLQSHKTEQNTVEMKGGKNV